VQTLRRDQNERLYRLLQEFDKLTGVPVLLNTSFNVKGEPIVETPEDAINCFLATGIDYLALHDVLMTKKRAHRVIAPVIRTYSEIAALVRTTLSVEMPR
jgi:carbamoyltransferase